MVIFTFVYFQPQKLFIDDRVNEKLPSATVATSSPSVASEQTSAAPAEMKSAPFRSLEHKTTGEAIITEMPDGSRVLSFKDFATSNGPDLRVYLSAGTSDAGFGKAYGEQFVELGRLKGNIGDQNYNIPKDIDLSKFNNAVIWCKRFSVGFGVATL